MAGPLSVYTPFFQRSSRRRERGGDYLRCQPVDGFSGAQLDIGGVPPAGPAPYWVGAGDPIVELAPYCVPVAPIAFGTICAGDTGVAHAHLFGHLALLLIRHKRYKDAVDQTLPVFVDDSRITAVAIPGARNYAVGDDACPIGQSQFAALAIPG